MFSVEHGCCLSQQMQSSQRLGVVPAGIQGTGDWLSNAASRPGSCWRNYKRNLNSASTHDLLNGFPHLQVLSHPSRPLFINSSTAQRHLERPRQSKCALKHGLVVAYGTRTSLHYGR